MHPSRIDRLRGQVKCFVIRGLMWGRYDALNNAQLDVRQIRQIIEISRQGGIGRAARELGISQPALSRSIARIEDQLGTILFERSGEGAKPTAYADYIVSRAVPAMESMATIAHEVRMMAKGEAGRLRIGLGPIIRDLIFPEVSDRMLAAFPKLSLRVQVANAPDLKKELRSRHLDVAINSSEHQPVATEADPESFFVKTSLFSLHLSFFARPDHPILRRPLPASAGDLLDFPMAGVGFTREQRAIFPAKLTPVQRHNLGAYQLTDYLMVRRVVLNSDAIGYVPDLIFANDVTNGHIAPIKLDFKMEHHCVALTLLESWHSTIVRKFVAIARDVAGDMQLTT